MKREVPIDLLFAFRNCELYVDSVYERKVDLRGLFPEAERFVVEVGSGRGDFLVAFASRHPEVGLLGVEKEREFVERCIKRVVEAELRNVRLVWSAFEDAVRLFPDGSVWTFYFNFPDPWHKRKHKRKRMINPFTAAEMRRALAKGGSIRLLTDHAEMFCHTVSVLVEAGFEVKCSLFSDSGYPRTYYMEKFCGSRPPYYLEARLG